MEDEEEGEIRRKICRPAKRRRRRLPPSPQKSGEEEREEKIKGFRPALVLLSSLYS